MSRILKLVVLGTLLITLAGCAGYARRDHQTSYRSSTTPASYNYDNDYYYDNGYYYRTGSNYYDNDYYYDGDRSSYYYKKRTTHYYNR